MWATGSYLHYAIFDKWATSKPSNHLAMYLKPGCHHPFILFLLAYVMLRTIIGQRGNSSIICREQLRHSSIQLSKRARFGDVGHHLGLTRGTQTAVTYVLYSAFFVLLVLCSPRGVPV